MPSGESISYPDGDGEEKTPNPKRDARHYVPKPNCQDNGRVHACAHKHTDALAFVVAAPVLCEVDEIKRIHAHVGIRACSYFFFGLGF